MVGVSTVCGSPKRGCRKKMPQPLLESGVYYPFNRSPSLIARNTGKTSEMQIKYLDKQ